MISWWDGPPCRLLVWLCISNAPVIALSFAKIYTYLLWTHCTSYCWGGRCLADFSSKLESNDPNWLNTGQAKKKLPPTVASQRYHLFGWSAKPELLFLQCGMNEGVRLFLHLQGTLFHRQTSSNPHELPCGWIEMHVSGSAKRTCSVRSIKDYLVDCQKRLLCFFCLGCANTLPLE